MLYKGRIVAMARKEMGNDKSISNIHSDRGQIAFLVQLTDKDGKVPGAAARASYQNPGY
jgi:hypothetical protein